MHTIGAIGDRGGLKQLAVLYVEDDEGIREQLAQFLRRRVGRLYTADNGRAGLEAFRRYRPDIVVSDIRMPEMNGLEMAEEIKRDSAGAPVILTSAFSDTDYVLKAIDIGIDKYVLKPVKVDALVSALQHSAEVLQARRELQLAATVFQVISESVLITDARRVLIAVNPAFEKMTGYRQAEILGREVSYLDADAAADAPSWQTLAAAGRGKSEVVVRRHDGTMFTGWVTADTVRRDDGDPAYIVFVLADLSERKAAEEALKRVNEALEQRVRERTEELMEANRELESFSYSVSHDLAAPLRGIDGFASMLEESWGDRLDEDALANLRRIRTSTRRMASLIQDLLALSRVSRVEISRRECALSEMATEVIQDLRYHDPSRVVECAVAPGLTAYADPRLIRIVLENLLRNAWKFTARRVDAHIEFGASRHDAVTVFRVRDNGAGFDMESAGKLFAPFERLHRQDEFEGTGVGLAIVERIVRRHGGAIWAEAELDKGATFFFRLG